LGADGCTSAASSEPADFAGVRSASYATAAAFLQVPWELLANEQGFLAADAVLNYCPLRRLGEPGAIPRASDLCLGLVFMAPAAHGADELDFEGEESAILAAPGPRSMSLAAGGSNCPTASWVGVKSSAVGVRTAFTSGRRLPKHARQTTNGR
jgi:hypothetical protein